MLARRLAAAGLAGLATIAAGPSVFAAGDPLAYCKSDKERLCPGVELGGGRVMRCLKEHKMEVSVGCAQALKKMKAEMGK